MKSIKILTICFFIALVLFSGVTSALPSSTGISIDVSLSNNNLTAASEVTVFVDLTNNSPNSITIYAVGIHFDWMNNEGFQGPNLSNSPPTVAGGTSKVFDFVCTIPVTISAGAHNFYVGVDGVNYEGQPVSYNSPEYIVDSGIVTIVNPTASPTPIPTATSTDTPTATPTSNLPSSTKDSTQQENKINSQIITYSILAIVALVAIVAIVALVLRKH